MGAFSEQEGCRYQLHMMAKRTASGSDGEEAAPTIFQLPQTTKECAESSSPGGRNSVLVQPEDTTHGCALRQCRGGVCCAWMHSLHEEETTPGLRPRPLCSRKLGCSHSSASKRDFGGDLGHKSGAQMLGDLCHERRSDILLQCHCDSKLPHGFRMVIHQLDAERR